jgi:hypothetical protein
MWSERFHRPLEVINADTNANPGSGALLLEFNEALLLEGRLELIAPLLAKLKSASFDPKQEFYRRFMVIDVAMTLIKFDSPLHLCVTYQDLKDPELARAELLAVKCFINEKNYSDAETFLRYMLEASHVSGDIRKEVRSLLQLSLILSQPKGEDGLERLGQIERLMAEENYEKAKEGLNDLLSDNSYPRELLARAAETLKVCEELLGDCLNVKEKGIAGAYSRNVHQSNSWATLFDDNVVSGRPPLSPVTVVRSTPSPK